MNGIHMLKFWKEIINFLFLFISIYFLVINLYVYFEILQTHKKTLRLINTHVLNLRNSTYTTKAPCVQPPEHILLCTTCSRNNQSLSLVLISYFLYIMLHTHTYPKQYTILFYVLKLYINGIILYSSWCNLSFSLNLLVNQLSWHRQHYFTFIFIIIWYFILWIKEYILSIFLFNYWIVFIVFHVRKSTYVICPFIHWLF